MTIGRTNVAQQWAQKTHEGKELMTEASIPTQYKDFANVFSEEAATHFPPIRDDDHAIQFKPTVPDTFSCKIYPISIKETKFLRGWIDENLGKNFIRESRSPYTSPTFLIKKKNGDFRIIQDYRTLNKHTIPNVSPLPLIRSLIENCMDEHYSLSSTFGGGTTTSAYAMETKRRRHSRPCWASTNQWS